MHLRSLSGLGWLVALGATACNPAGAQTEMTALHGAAAMEMQQGFLDGLRVRDPRPPSWVDREVWQMRIPGDNQPGLERVALGRALYFDVRLSADGTVACATCHDVTRAMTDRRPLAEGIGGKVGRRNAPTTMNAALLPSQSWDGRASSLEEQALLPIVNPAQMGHVSGDDAVRAIAGDARYKVLFHIAYGRPPNFQDIGRAIASFERTLVFLDAPFDRFLLGEERAISASAARGWALFNGKAGCAACHPVSPSSPLGTDGRFHNIGVSARQQNLDALAARALTVLAVDSSRETIDALAVNSEASDLGRFLVSREQADIGAFRTPPLRNLGVTAPYMHDGSLSTLWDVVDHYDRGGEPNRFLDRRIRPLALTEGEIADLVELLFAMTDLRFASQNMAERERQREIASQRRPLRDAKPALPRRLAFRVAPHLGPPAPARLDDVGGLDDVRGLK
jgi:cytochrome c peroxidase